MTWVLTRSLDWRCRAARHGSRARTHSGARCGGRFARWIASAVHRPNRAFAVGRPADGRGCTRDRPAVRHGPIDRRPTAGAFGNTTRADIAPDQAILREASRGYDLVVLGVSRRSGDMLFFGNTATAVLEWSPTSILFVAS